MLASAIGTSVRTLQAGFCKHRRTSPMTFLRERRFELARTRLLAAMPGTTVGRVAADCGFERFGRFSQCYGARFGEAPVQTRARVLCRTRP